MSRPDMESGTDFAYVCVKCLSPEDPGVEMPGRQGGPGDSPGAQLNEIQGRVQG